MKASDLTAVQDFFHQLAARQDTCSLEAAFQDLAKIYDADGIGLSSVRGTSTDIDWVADNKHPTVFPWNAQAELLIRLQRSLRAETLQTNGKDWLIALASDPHAEPELIWAYRVGKGPWSDADRWSWMFAGQTLMRWRRQSAWPVAALQQQLEHAALVTGRLTHDFGNYLTGIMGFTELSLLQTPPDSLLYRYLSEVLQSAKQGADWLRRLHLFCRRSGVQMWPTPITTVLAEQETNLRASGVLSLRWLTDISPALPLVAIDADALHGIVAELVHNAREAGNDQGTIAFTARERLLTETDCNGLLGLPRPGAYVELNVSDDGPGIPLEDRSRLFHEAFFSTKPRHRGLGLRVVYGILQRFHGGMRLAPAQGKGTTVQLYLPVAPIDGPAAPADSPRVLLLHSDPTLFESMKKILETAGFRVSIAVSPSPAFSTYATPGNSFALVITDVLLAQSSGFDLARRILDHDPKANFLFLHTQASYPGYTEEDLLTRFALLRWPVQPPTFLKAVQNALTRAREKR